MKYLIFLLSLTSLSALASVGKMKTHKKNGLHCRDNDYYCQSQLNDATSEKLQNEENSLSQFDGKVVKDVTNTLGQGLSTSIKK